MPHTRKFVNNRKILLGVPKNKKLKIKEGLQTQFSESLFLGSTCVSSGSRSAHEAPSVPITWALTVTDHPLPEHLLMELPCDPITLEITCQHEDFERQQRSAHIALCCLTERG